MSVSVRRIVRPEAWDFRADDADYNARSGTFSRPMNPAQQQVLFENTTRAMGDAPEYLQLHPACSD